MAKKGSVKKDYGNMSELDATAEYERTLNDVYKERGFLATAGYELKSTGYSIWKRLGNVIDHGIVAEGNAKYKELEREPITRGYSGYSDYLQSKNDIARRTAERRAFILRDSKKLKGLEATTATASILGLAGGAFLLSSNMTGNVIADYSTETTSLVGVLLFVIAIIAGVLWLSLKKEKSRKVVVKKVVKKVSKKKRK